jgi:hypothetical protein
LILDSQTTARRHEQKRGIWAASVEGFAAGDDDDQHGFDDPLEAKAAFNVGPVEEKQQKAKQQKATPEAKVSMGLVDLVGKGLLTQTGAAKAAKVYSDALSPIFETEGLDIYLPKTFYSLKKNAGVSKDKGMLLDVCTKCCHVYFKEDQDETTCPQPGCGAPRQRETQQCLIFDIQSQIGSCCTDTQHTTHTHTHTHTPAPLSLFVYSLVFRKFVHIPE